MIVSDSKSCYRINVATKKILRHTPSGQRILSTRIDARLTSIVLLQNALNVKAFSGEQTPTRVSVCIQRSIDNPSKLLLGCTTNHLIGENEWLLFVQPISKQSSDLIIRIIVSCGRFNVSDSCIFAKGRNDEAAFNGLELGQDSAFQLFFRDGWKNTEFDLDHLRTLIQVELMNDIVVSQKCVTVDREAETKVGRRTWGFVG